MASLPPRLDFKAQQPSNKSQCTCLEEAASVLLAKTENVQQTSSSSKFYLTSMIGFHSIESYVQIVPYVVFNKIKSHLQLKEFRHFDHIDL